MFFCEGRKELAHTTVRLQLILFSKVAGAFSFQNIWWISPHTYQIYCLSGTKISETHIIIIIMNNTTRSSAKLYLFFGLDAAGFNLVWGTGGTNEAKGQRAGQHGGPPGWLEKSDPQGVILHMYGWSHRVHRVATSAFWRTFSHEGKISPGW